MKKTILVIILIFILVYYVFFYYSNDIVKEGTTMNCNITNVVDGDTVDLTCGAKVITNNRLLGIDTPELGYKGQKDGCMSLEAKNFMENLSYTDVDGIKIYKEFRVNFFGADDCVKGICRNEIVLYDIDTDDNINKMLVSKGYAYVWEKYLYRKIVKKEIRDNFSKSIKTFPKYLELQKEAMNGKRGIWGKCEVTLNKTNKGRLYIIK